MATVKQLNQKIKQAKDRLERLKGLVAESKSNISSLNEQLKEAKKEESQNKTTKKSKK